MTPKKALSAYLTKLIKGRVKALAAGMDMTEETLKLLAAVEEGRDPMSLAQVVKLSSLTDTDPKVILNLQMDIQLEDAGAVPYKPAKVVKPAKPAIRPTGKSPAIMPERRHPRGSVVR